MMVKYGLPRDGDDCNKCLPIVTLCFASSDSKDLCSHDTINDDTL